MLTVFITFVFVLAGAAHGAPQPSLTPNIIVGGQSTLPQWSCAASLEETAVHKDSRPYVIGKVYKLRNGNRSCAEIYVGVYGDTVKKAIETGEGWATTNLNSSYAAAVFFMERAGITCRMQDGMFSLVFPSHDYSHDDYGTIDLNCAAESALTKILIGLNEKSGDSLSIHYAHLYNPLTWHAFDIDKDGVIKKHTVGVGHSPTAVVLDNYEK